MAKKDNNYYELKKSAVDRLVNANEKNSPEVSDDEIAKISGKKRHRIPNPVKAIFIKWWFAGAIFFFFDMGLSTYVGTLDLLFILGAAMGILSDLLTNHMLRFVEPSAGANDKYMMVTTRKFWSLFLNIPYAFIVLYVVLYIFSLIRLFFIAVSPDGLGAKFGLEPISFGLIYLAVDMLFIGMKRLMIKIVDDAKASK